MATSANNNVKIVKSWSLMAFAKEFGTPKFAPFENKATGEKFNSLVFDNEGDLTFCHLGKSCQNMDSRDIVREKNNLKVGLNSNDKYTLYKENSSWETLDLF